MLDTHAGSGRYALECRTVQQRTGEWRNGIARLLNEPPPALAEYVGLVGRTGPAILARRRSLAPLLRPDDRMACCELHPEDAAGLRRQFARDPQVSVHRRDGWEAIGGLLPPKERRGLVLIDPPYEDPQDEFADVARRASRSGSRVSEPACFAAWYPIKHRAPVRAFHWTDARRAAFEILSRRSCGLREPVDPARLERLWDGAGGQSALRFEEQAAAILAALLERLGDREPGEGTAVRRLVE